MPAKAPVNDSSATRREGLERVTVNLTPKAAQALEQAVKLTGDSKTDTINRSLQVYAYLEEILQHGGSLYTRVAGESELERLHFF
jgi:hypothetical protein